MPDNRFTRIKNVTPQKGRKKHERPLKTVLGASRVAKLLDCYVMTKRFYSGSADHHALCTVARQTTCVISVRLHETGEAMYE